MYIFILNLFLAFNFYTVNNLQLEELIKSAENEYYSNNYEASLNKIELVLLHVDEINDADLWGKAMFIKANNLVKLNKSIESQTVIKSIISKSNLLSSAKVSLSLYKYAEILFKNEDYNIARKYAFESLRFVSQSKSMLLEANIHQLIASIEINKGNYEESIKNNQKAFRIAKNLEIKDSLYFADILYDLALGYQKKGKYRIAVSKLQEALSLIKYKKNDLMPFINSLLGTIYYKIGNYNKAIEAFYLAENVISKNHVLHSYLEVKLGFSHLMLKEYEGVKEKIKGLKLKEQEYKALYGFKKLLAADLALELDSFQKAEVLYFEALSHEQEEGNHIQALTLHNRLGKLFLKQDKLPKAIFHLFVTRKHADILSSREVNSENYLLLYQYYDKRGDESKAKDMIASHLALEKETSQDYLKALYMALEISYEEDIQKAINKNKTIEESLFSIRKLNSKMSIIIISLSILLLTILLFLHKNYKRRVSSENDSTEFKHRVKNDLALLQSLNEYEDNPSIKTHRIHAISLIHRHLDITNFKRNKINIKAYISELIDLLSKAYNNDKAQFIYSIENVTLKPNKALKIGILINELITNSIKHAFREQEQPTITIGLKKENRKLFISYEDNGPGITNTKLKMKHPIGIHIIDDLVEDMYGKTEVELPPNGLKINFEFNV